MGDHPETRPGRRGRPALVSAESILEAAGSFAPDQLGVAAVAKAMGVGATTIRDHIGSGERLWSLSCARRVATLSADVDEVRSWTGYLEVLCRRIHVLVRAHPGIERYLIYGPYRPDTLAFFEAVIAQVERRQPEMTRSTAGLVASQAVVLTASLAGLRPRNSPADDRYTPESGASWALSALLDGMTRKIATRDLPPFRPVTDDPAFLIDD